MDSENAGDSRYVMCPSCGGANYPDVPNCHWCGSPTREAPTVETGLGPVEPPDAVDEFEPQPQLLPIDGDDDPEWDSKAAIFFGQQTDEPTPSAVAGVESATCPKCEAHAPLGAPFCPECGAELTPAPLDLGDVVGRLVDPAGGETPISTTAPIGRDGRNTISPPDTAISRLHCRLDPLSTGVLLTDLDSKNGTWLNGRRIKHDELADGDHIVVGRTELIYRGMGRIDVDAGEIREEPPASPKMMGRDL